MVVLLLNNTRVYISTQDNIKLTRENSFFTAAGDHTMEVLLPMTIYPNIDFFGPWQRLEVNKDNKVYVARLYINNICVINGSAKVTAVTNEAVKLQLYGDRSEINAVYGDKYIDELTLPYNSSKTVIFAGNGLERKKGDKYVVEEDPSIILTDANESYKIFMYNPIYNETAEGVRNIHTALAKADGTKELYTKKNCIQFNFLYVISSVFKAIGYDCDLSAYEIPPFANILVANARMTHAMSDVLPHWTFKEFIEQIQYLLNCTLAFSSNSCKVTARPNKLIINSDVISLSQAEDFNIDVSDESDTKSIVTSNIKYSLSDSKNHDNDFISEDKIKVLSLKEYNSKDDLLTAYKSMSDSDKETYLLRCPDGDYCKWVYSGSQEGDYLSGLIEVNQLKSLIRNVKDDNEIEIKIVPVAIAPGVEVPIYVQAATGGTTNHSGSNYLIQKANEPCYQVMPSMPTIAESDGGTWGNGNRDTVIKPAADPSSIQDAITSSDTVTKEEKPDRMEIYLYDGKTQEPTQYFYTGKKLGVQIPSTFISWNYKNINCQEHEHWSLALKSGAKDTFNIGDMMYKEVVNDLHLYTIKFLADNIPSANNIYIFNGVKYLAERIEITIKNDGIDKLMTGYFYRMK